MPGFLPVLWPGPRILRWLSCVVLLAPLDASAQALQDLVLDTPPGATLTLPAGTTSGRADIAHGLAIAGTDGSVLTAPEDQAILLLLPGADLALSGVTLSQTGATQFAAYVDGGSLNLSDCRIEGAFEVAIYVASGSVSVTNCTIRGGLFGIQAGPGASVSLDGVELTGQGDTAIRVDGADLDLHEVRVSQGKQNGIIATAAPSVQADGLTVTGLFETGIWIEGSPQALLTRVVVQVAGQALTISGGDEVSLDGFRLQGGSSGLVVDGATGTTQISRGQIDGGPGATTALLRDLAGLDLADVAIIGGETGLYLAGSLPGAGLSHLMLHSQTGTGLFLDGTGSAAPIEMTGLRIAAPGQALAAYFRDSGPVTLTDSALMAEGALVFASEGASEPLFQSSTLIAAPDLPESFQVFEAAPGKPLAFLPDGGLWWTGDPALAHDSRAMTLAGFAASLPTKIGLHAPVLDFAQGQKVKGGDLMLALAYAVPPAPPPKTAVTTVRIDLAPPGPGWLWDPNAARITLTGADGLQVNAVPGDFPLQLAAGDYALEIDGRSMGRVTLTAGLALTLPLPEAPFYAWRDDQGQKWRGPALYLRPKAELTALLAGFRPLRPGEYWGYAPQTAPRAGADRALAAAFIAGARDRLPAILDALAQHQTAEAWPAFNLRWLEANLTLDVLAAFGSAEDAAWLLSLPVPEGVQINHLDAAVLIETRIGILADGAALAMATGQMDGGLPDTPDARRELIRLVQSLGRSGLPQGQALLADLVAALQAEPENAAPVPTGIVELSRLDPTLAAGLPGQFLDRFVLYMDAYLDGQLPADATKPLYLDLWNAAVAAMVHEAVHAPPGSPTRRLPVPPDAGIGSSAWAFADPLTALGGAMGRIGPPDPNRLSGWTYRFPEFICAALAYRSAADREAQYATLRDTLTTAVGLAFADETTDPAALSDIFNQAAFALDVTLGECVLSDAVLNNFSRNAAGEEAAIFDNLDYEPLWWLRRPRTEAQLAAFARGEDYPVLTGHSAVPLPEIEAMLATGTAADPDLKAAFLTHHQLLSDAFQSDLDVLTFGAEHRQFRLRSDAGNGSITIAGYLDIRPILSNARLIIAIRHRIESPDYGGLAAMITQPDRAPYEADNRLLMFEAVTLDQAGGETALAHEGTSANGVQFFAMPHQGDFSDQTLHLKLRFVDTIWEIDIPLWASALAHDLRVGAVSEVQE
jgi:Right handed beta helix region